MMNTVVETNMTQAVKDASLPRPSGIKKKKGSTSEPQGAEAQRMGLVCMVGTMLSSLNTKNSTGGDLMLPEDHSAEAQRTTYQGSTFSPKSREPKSTKDSLTMNGLTEEKVAAAAASTRIPDQKGADNIFDDVEVVYCKLRGDDCSTVAGDYSDEDSLSSVGSCSDDDDECSILGEKNDATFFSDSEGEKTEQEDEIHEEQVNVAEWQGVAGRLASVFKNALDEDELEEEAQEQEEEEAEDGVEKIDIRNWENVGARVALVFQAAAEEDWEE